MNLKQEVKLDVEHLLELLLDDGKECPICRNFEFNEKTKKALRKSRDLDRQKHDSKRS